MEIDVEITPGAELDCTVAEAIGWFQRKDGVFNRAWHSAVRQEWPVDQFCPSRDLNAAFAAAEKAGVFYKTFWRTLGMDELGETWGVFEQDGYVKISIAGDQYETPALAICAAILELKDKDG